MRDYLIGTVRNACRMEYRTLECTIASFHGSVLLGAAKGGVLLQIALVFPGRWWPLGGRRVVEVIVGKWEDGRWQDGEDWLWAWA